MRKTLLVLASVLCAGAAVTSASAAVKPWQWTTARAQAAMKQQAMSFYRVAGSDVGGNLASVWCRGTGKAVQHRFTAFTCSVLVEGNLRVRVNAKTRRAGGLCWATAPARIPSACLAPGVRATGSLIAAKGAMFDLVGGANQFFGCWPNGAGFFSCAWTDVKGNHSGTVVFSPGPRAKVLS